MFNVSIIIPTYNEAKNLPFLTEEIFGLIDKDKIDLEIIFVDDNSPDGTGIVADNLSERYPVKVIHRQGKMGLGSAVVDGFNYSKRDILGVMDGDMSHDPSIVNNLIYFLENHDISIGSRFEVESSVDNWNWWRKLVSCSGVFLARILTGAKDPLSGYFFVRRDVINNLNITTKGYKILLEILVKGKYKKCKEIPYTFRMRKFSTSKLSYKEFLLFAGQLIFYSFYKIKKFFTYG